MPPLRRRALRLRVPNNPERAAFIAHRATGLALLAFFAAHATTMGLALAGVAPAARAASAIISSPWLRWAVATILAFHGLNGLRLLLVEALNAGIGRPEPPRPPYVSTSLRSGQRPMLYVIAVLTLVAAVLAAYAAFWA
jgi:succinate dehydrogenase / fumarate reductase cytochrome b subunit